MPEGRGFLKTHIRSVFGLSPYGYNIPTMTSYKSSLMSDLL